MVGGYRIALDPLIEEPIHRHADVLFHYAAKIVGGRARRRERVVEIPHHGTEAVVLGGVEIEHQHPQHVDHPRALLVDEGLIAVPSLAGTVAVTEPRRARALSNFFDVPEILIQEAKVLLVAFAYALQIPESAERREPFAHPDIAIGGGPDTVAPPLMRDLVGPEKFVESIDRRVLKRHPRQIDHPRKRDALKVGDLRDVEMVEQRRAKGVT